MTDEEIIHTLSTCPPAALPAGVTITDIDPPPRSLVEDQAVERLLSITDEIIRHAVRYSLATGEDVGITATCVTDYWTYVHPRIQHQIHAEVRDAVAAGQYVNEVDRALWTEVLRLPLVGVLIAPPDAQGGGG